MIQRASTIKTKTIPKLKKMEARLQAVLARELDKVTREIMEDAVNNAPIRTGNLRNSVFRITDKGVDNPTPTFVHTPLQGQRLREGMVGAESMDADETDEAESFTGTRKQEANVQKLTMGHQAAIAKAQLLRTGPLKKFLVVIGFSAYYAQWVHDGGPKNSPPKPFLRDAWVAGMKKMTAELSAVISQVAKTK